jgi:hypothetical protein
MFGMEVSGGLHGPATTCVVLCIVKAGEGSILVLLLVFLECWIRKILIGHSNKSRGCAKTCEPTPAFTKQYDKNSNSVCIFAGEITHA